MLKLKVRLVVVRGKGSGARRIESLGLADANYYIYIGWINNKILLYSTGNHSLASGTITEKNVEKNIYHLYIHICM